MRGASRSARRISSITGLYRSSPVAFGSSFLRGSGHDESDAFRTVRHVTPCLRSSSRIDMPPRWSRRIAAYNSAFGIRGMTSAFHREHPEAVPARTPAPPELVDILHPWNRAPLKSTGKRRRYCSIKPALQSEIIRGTAPT
ncbi:hypothetical protein [Streptomyces sudanensis]|uniref:hypothetical protein n=1 Tax=Streptomyces sudanensis TaxID=436397 RepID=UPI0020CEBBD2|nr:hypothetical protein [Streptomyces sudanensis]MCP9956562.1 hypothetical protein [Streptomyces sudanensis]MCQ0002834.1 hypothetical protein [Streptomyces sudanensis]